MGYDLFLSYSRGDNAQGRITELLRHIQADFQKHAQRELRVFFDQEEIRGMEDWRLRILQGLRDSHLLLACLSPGYLASQNCKWEFNEYLKHEIGRAGGSHGVVPVYLVEVPSWEQKGDKQQNEAWADELRRRQYFDLRLWYDQGAAALLEAAVQERMAELSHRIWDAIQHGERAARSPGNVEAHNPHFVGRRRPLRQLRQNFVEPGRISVLTAVHGMGGLGKTALATEYAHAYAEEYGGGRWLVRCAGREDLRLALAELAPAVGFEFTEDEKKSADRLFERVRRELQQLAAGGNPPRCLLILDNVDQPGLLDPAMVARLNGGDWLHVLATTRLGENELGGTHRDRAFLPLDELPGDEALALMESYQPGGAISPRDGAGGRRRDSAAAGELHPGGGSGGGVSGAVWGGGQLRGVSGAAGAGGVGGAGSGGGAGGGSGAAWGGVFKRDAGADAGAAGGGGTAGVAPGGVAAVRPGGVAVAARAGGQDVSGVGAGCGAGLSRSVEPCGAAAAEPAIAAGDAGGGRCRAAARGAHSSAGAGTDAA